MDGLGLTLNVGMIPTPYPDDDDFTPEELQWINGDSDLDHSLILRNDDDIISALPRLRTILSLIVAWSPFTMKHISLDCFGKDHRIEMLVTKDFPWLFRSLKFDLSTINSFIYIGGDKISDIHDAYFSDLFTKMDCVTRLMTLDGHGKHYNFFTYLSKLQHLIISIDLYRGNTVDPLVVDSLTHLVINNHTLTRLGFAVRRFPGEAVGETTLSEFKDILVSLRIDSRPIHVYEVSEEWGIRMDSLIKVIDDPNYTKAPELNEKDFWAEE
ncbi:hypothetical protein M422DRAFT_256305 [Sphaerobolus stellatus SS14]|uniref:Uncharacterized protein n=1 Tax=Sphaerobolus stellatus (strain SS14) TaxID=990650 RepID=A0A0C9V0J4_SPHS4|nr:hypothetical protein M422DRAFT_256305 [Sphaerobolus stellatus SS14]